MHSVQGIELQENMFNVCEDVMTFSILYSYSIIIQQHIAYCAFSDTALNVQVANYKQAKDHCHLLPCTLSCLISIKSF